MALTTFYTPRWRAVDQNGAPYPNAVLSFFEAGTVTPLPVYSDVNGSTAIGVTVTADSGGLFAEMFMLPQAYDITLKDQNGVTIWTAVDWFPPQAASSANVDLTGTAGVAFSAGDLAYLSDGSGGLNAGQWYKADADLAYASETPETGFAVSAITLGDTGLFRTSGKITGLSGLTPGALYYISGTAGAISSSPGAFPRMIGQAESTTVLVVQTNPPLPTRVIDARIKTLCNGRLTLTTGVPVTPGDVTAAGTLFWAPYQGNQIALYSGSAWVVFAQAQLSIAVPAVANQVYDAFVDYNAGVPALTLTAWTNDTTRATALTTQDGVLVLSGTLGKRYVGTVRTVSASQLNDSAALRHVWNYYNRVESLIGVADATASWAYSTATWRQSRAQAANQVDLVCGFQESALDLEFISYANNDAGAGVFVNNGIGEDSTTVPTVAGAMNFVTANMQQHVVVKLTKIPAIGRHFYAMLEASQATPITTFFGTAAATTAGTGTFNSYLRGTWFR